MASLKVPAHVPSVAEDCEQLRSAFKGIIYILKWIYSLLYTWYTIGSRFATLNFWVYSLLGFDSVSTFWDHRDLNFYRLMDDDNFKIDWSLIILELAVAGWGTNEKLIISILAHRNAAQRKLIRQTYAETYGEDLLKELDRELTHDFEVIFLFWA